MFQACFESKSGRLIQRSFVSFRVCPKYITVEGVRFNRSMAAGRLSWSSHGLVCRRCEAEVK